MRKRGDTLCPPKVMGRLCVERVGADVLGEGGHPGAGPPQPMGVLSRREMDAEAG